MCLWWSSGVSLLFLLLPDPPTKERLLMRKVRTEGTLFRITTVPENTIEAVKA